MTRLRDTRSGVVVDVDDATAARLGSAYQPVKAEAHVKRSAPAKKAPVSSPDSK